jgi:hypothetical protein
VGVVCVRLGRNCARAAIVFLTYLAIAESVHVRYPNAQAGVVVEAAILGTILAWVTWKVLVKLGDAIIDVRTSVLAVVLSCVACIGAGLLLVNAAHTAIATGEALGLGLIAAPFLGTGVFVATRAIGLVGYLKTRNLKKEAAREAILDIYLDTAEEMRIPDNRNDLSYRKRWLTNLEQAAKMIERDLPRAMTSDGVETDAWMAERAKGAAAGLRRVNRQIAVSGADTLDRVVSILNSQAVALACGDFASLKWAPPPPPEARRRRWWRSAFIALRTLLVMAVPLVAILALQSYLGLTGNALVWAKIIALGWAALYLLITIDPTVSDKIATARNLIGIVRETKLPRSAHDGEREG